MFACIINSYLMFVRNIKCLRVKLLVLNWG
jgi:hypothetical protein